jgi:hypothetical protein
MYKCTFGYLIKEKVGACTSQIKCEMPDEYSDVQDSLNKDLMNSVVVETEGLSK